MLKQQAILATFETLPLDERRKLLGKLAEKSNLVVNHWICEDENIFRDEEICDIPQYFLQFLFNWTDEKKKTFYFKEHIQKAFRLFLLIKEKCNYASLKRSEDRGNTFNNTFCLAYKPGVQTWELKLIDYPYPICLTNKEEFFDTLLQSFYRNCYVCLLYKGEFNYYQSFYDLATDKDEYHLYRKKWKLPKFSEL